MNRLADETSPYLRQHRDNPVDWYPWGEEAFAAARERDVPILLSVGYSACHWCHVMAHECFEDADTAALMNAGFVNVKVDREERPDVDSLYMDAVQAMTGRGGWPMTMFLTPDGEPFYGGTYFPKGTFAQVLGAVTDAYRTKPDDVRKNVATLLEAVARTSKTKPIDELPGLEQLNALLQGLARAFDAEWGGFGTAPKFPSTFNLDLILRAYMTNGAEPLAKIIGTTLDAMCSGGMYDHVGGGFARYSTDREWLVPHFEKMLYDQALLVRHLRPGVRRVRTTAVAPGRRGDDRLRRHRTAPPRRRLLLGRGRRLADARRRERRGVVPRHGPPTRCAGRSPTSTRRPSRR